MAWYLVFLAFILQSSALPVSNTTKNQVNMTVYYEVASSDSLQFMDNEVYETYKKFGDKFITLELVPLGKIQVNDSTENKTITCAKGEFECTNLKMHVCALKQYNQNQSLIFINCIMTLIDLVEDQCRQDCMDLVDADKINECTNKQETIEAILSNQEKALSAKLHHLPAVAYDGVYRQVLSERSEFDLFSIVCVLINLASEACKDLFF